MAHLLIGVRFLEGRYHGSGGWPPSPARLFQALVAGAGLEGHLEEHRMALVWLEGLEPPIILAPHARPGQRVPAFVPNNDVKLDDVVPGGLRRTRRDKKIFSPVFFSAEQPLLYLWHTEDPSLQEHLPQIASLAGSLFQLGRSLDWAHAWAELLDAEEATELRQRHPGLVLAPSPALGGEGLACPVPGSLESLSIRYAHRRFGSTPKKGRGAPKTHYAKPPSPRFYDMPYGGTGTMAWFELHDPDAPGRFRPWPLERATELIVQVRDRAHRRLADLPNYRQRLAELDRVIIGRRPGEQGPDSLPSRVRFIPLPSVGHPEADLLIRRLLVLVPPRCPLPAEDVFWAVSGELAVVPEGADEPPAREGAATEVFLSRSRDEPPLLRLGVTTPGAASTNATGTRHWVSVTPVILPLGRRTPDSTPVSGTARRKRLDTQEKHALIQALRHAGVRADLESCTIQREPFQRHGRLASDFVAGTRFPQEVARHVRLESTRPIEGPLVLGNGRFLGLGLFVPEKRCSGIYAFRIEGGLEGSPGHEDLVPFLRRAVLARAQAAKSNRGNLPTFFTGHRADGSPGDRSEEAHIAFAYEPDRELLLVVAPHRLEARPPSRREVGNHLPLLEQALAGFRTLLSGRWGRLRLAPAQIDEDHDPVFARCSHWRTWTPYAVQRHHRRGDVAVAIQQDFETACRAAGLPSPTKVVVSPCPAKPRRPLEAHVEVRFPQAVPGPLALGRTRHKGGGWFIGVEER